MITPIELMSTKSQDKAKLENVRAIYDKIVLKYNSMGYEEVALVFAVNPNSTDDDVLLYCVEDNKYEVVPMDKNNDNLPSTSVRTQDAINRLRNAHDT